MTENNIEILSFSDENLKTIDKKTMTVAEQREAHAANLRYLITASDDNGVSEYVRVTGTQNALVNNCSLAVKFAMDYDQFDCARALVEAGADASLSTTSVPSAFWSATRYDRLAYMKLFLRHTSEECLRQVRNQRFGNDETLLHLAVRCASANMVQLLLESGFDPNAQNNEGNTPLHLLDLQHSKQMANVFFHVKGAIQPDFLIRNDKNLTAEQSAMDKGIREILRNQRRKQILMRQKMSYRERASVMARQKEERLLRRQKRARSQVWVRADMVRS